MSYEEELLNSFLYPEQVVNKESLVKAYYEKLYRTSFFFGVLLEELVNVQKTKYFPLLTIEDEERINNWIAYKNWLSEQIYNNWRKNAETSKE